MCVVVAAENEKQSIRGIPHLIMPLYDFIKFRNVHTSAHPLSSAELTHSLFTSRSSWLQGDFPQQRPLRSVQVQTAQSCSDGELGRSKGVLLQSHSVGRWSSRSPKCLFSVAEEKWIAALPETSVHDEGRQISPRTVTTGHRTGTLSYTPIFMRLRKLCLPLICHLVS